VDKSAKELALWNAESGKNTGRERGPCLGPLGLVKGTSSLEDISPTPTTGTFEQILNIQKEYKQYTPKRQQINFNFIVIRFFSTANIIYEKDILQIYEE
jgi:hypothetical protein